MKVLIEKIVNGGYGLGRVNGQVCLVPYTVPGDVVELGLPSGGDGRNAPLIFEIRDIIEPSPRRVQSQCPVFGLCGGCDYDHLTYEYELTVKRDVILEDLRRIASLAIEDVSVVQSPSEYGYRNHAYVRVGEEGCPGFFMKRSHQVVAFPSEGCLLLDRILNDLVKEMLRDGPFKEGGIRIRANMQDETFCRGLPGRIDDVEARYRVGDMEFSLGIDDFFQVNNLLNHRWVQLIEENLEPEPEDRLIDLFCGSGLIALSIAGSVRTITGIEGNGRAARYARFNAQRNGIDNVTFFTRDLTHKGALKHMAPSGEGPLKVVADPPRTGIAGHLIESIAALSPVIVVYVSCNSATLARDLCIFSRMGYRTERMTVIDMFPRTHHIEAVARLRFTGAGA